MKLELSIKCSSLTAPSRYGLPAVSRVGRGVWDGQWGMKLELSIECRGLTAPSRYGLPAVSRVGRGGFRTGSGE